jgi:hypothetical protein
MEQKHGAETWSRIMEQMYGAEAWSRCIEQMHGAERRMEHAEALSKQKYEARRRMEQPEP